MLLLGLVLKVCNTPIDVLVKERTEICGRAEEGDSLACRLQERGRTLDLKCGLRLLSQICGRSLKNKRLKVDGQLCWLRTSCPQLERRDGEVGYYLTPFMAAIGTFVSTYVGWGSTQPRCACTISTQMTQSTLSSYVESGPLKENSCGRG